MDEGINDEVKQEDEKRKMKLTTLQNLISEFRQDARALTGIQMKRNGIESAEELLDDAIDQFSRQYLS
jgi:hypothetical protein